MLRIAAGKGASRTLYYRCTGRGAQRRGCGNMVALAPVDQVVLNRIAYLSKAPASWVTRVTGAFSFS